MVHLRLASAYDKFKPASRQPPKNFFRVCPAVLSHAFVRFPHPARDPADHLQHCSMVLFALTRTYELSNSASLTSTAIVLGTPVPSKRTRVSTGTLTPGQHASK